MAQPPSDAPAPARPPAGPAWGLTLGVTAAVTLFVILVGRLASGSGWAGTMIAAVLMVVGWTEWGRPKGYEPPPWSAVAKSALDALIAAAVLLPAFAAALYVLATARGVRLEWWDPEQSWTQAGSLLALAAAEEMFFRGWLLARLDRHRPPARCFLGAPVSFNIVWASVAFAVCHVGIQGSAGLLTFFPGLAFGWLWAKRRSLAGPVLLHWLCNLLVLIVIRDFGSLWLRILGIGG